MSKKPALQSKKFIAFLTTEIFLFVFLMLATIITASGAAIISVQVIAVTGMVFLAVGYIGGVAWLDRYVQVAMITNGKIPEVNESDNA